MAVTAFHSRQRSQWQVPAAAIGLALVSGAALAVSPYYTAAAVVGLAVFIAIFLLPSRVLLIGFVLLTLSGFRPLPPVLGFHIQAQYFLMIPLLLRGLGERSADTSLYRPWQALLRASALVAGVGFIALVQDLVNPAVSATTAIGDYIAWVVVFIFLWVFVRLVRKEGRQFARVLYHDLVDALGLFAAIGLIGGLLHFGSYQQAASARLTLADLHPNETGLLLDVAILLIVTSMVMGRARWRDGLWLLFLFPLLVLTSSRESLISLGIGFALILLFMRDLRRALRYIFVLAIGLVSVFAFVAQSQSVVPTSLLRSMYIFPELVPYLHVFGFHLTPIVAERVYIQATGFQEFLQHPWFGVGFNQGIIITEGFNLPDWWTQPIVLKVAHDSFITVAAQQGLLGLIPFLILIAVSLRIAKNATRITRSIGEDYDLAVASRVAVITLVLASFNIDALYTDFKFTLIFFWVLVVAILVQQRPHASEAATPARSAAPRPRVPPRPRLLNVAALAGVAAPSLVPVPATRPSVPVLPTRPAGSVKVRTTTDHTVRNFIRNILTGWASRITSMGLTFLITPLLVHGLGREQYGLWAVALAFTAYLGLIDIGVTGGLVREISIANAEGRSDRISQLVATSIAFYAGIGAVLLVFVYALHDRIAALLGVPQSLVSSTGVLLVAVTAVLALENLTGAFNQVYTALEKMHITGVMTVLASGLNAIGYIVALWVFHGGIRDVALASVAAAATVTIVSGITAKAVCPAASISPRHISSAAFRLIIRLSLAIQLSNVAGVVNLQIDKLVLAGFVGLTAAGAYDIASRLAFVIWMLTWLIASAAFPVVSRLGTSPWDTIRPFYVRADCYLQTATFGLAGGLMAIAPWLVPLWLGSGFSRVVLITEVLAVSAVGICFTQVIKVTLWGLNRVREMIVFEAWRLAMHLGLSILLTWKFGLNGTLIGVLAGTITPALWLTWIGHRRLGIDTLSWIRSTLAAPLAAATLSVGASLALTRLALAPVIGQSSTFSLLILLAAGSIAFVLTYGAILLGLNSFPEEDLAVIRRLFRGGRERGLVGNHG